MKRNEVKQKVSLRGAAGDEAISVGSALSSARLLRFARNDSVRRIESFIQNGSTAEAWEIRNDDHIVREER
jgi:hypothetical protein